jgi:clan AA aspartic protease
MGITYAKAVVTGPTGVSETVDFLVDTGAQYTLLPRKVWKRLKLKAKRTESFRLADGSSVERKMSECHIEFTGKDGHTPIILGEPGDEMPLLGAVTLEELGLLLNPFSRQLQPMQLMLM